MGDGHQNHRGECLSAHARRPSPLADRERNLQHAQESGLQSRPQLRLGQKTFECRIHASDDAGLPGGPAPATLLSGLSGGLGKMRKQGKAMGINPCLFPQFCCSFNGGDFASYRLWRRKATLSGSNVNRTARQSTSFQRAGASPATRTERTDDKVLPGQRGFAPFLTKFAWVVQKAHQQGWFMLLWLRKSQVSRCCILHIGNG